MEGGERTLVPEWYKSSTSSGNTSGNSNHHNGLSLHPDDQGVRFSSSRNRQPVSARERDAPGFSKSSSSFRKNGGSNGYMSNDRESSSYSSSYSKSYINFGRNHSQRDRDSNFHDRVKSNMVGNGVSHHADTSVARADRDSMSRSNSLASERRVELLSKRPGVNSRNGGGSISSTTKKPSFEKDFPSLGSRERQSELSRLSSPALSTAFDNLSKITSATVGGEGWISALAEVPVKIGGSGPVTSSIPQTIAQTSASTALSSGTGLNMAETLAQAPMRNSTMPQMFEDTKKIEEFTRLQYSKLIPVTPTLSKSLASEKAKPKGLRSGDLSGSAKVGSHLSSQPVSQTVRALTKSDNAKSSQGGNFQVLNRNRNGIISSKDGSSLTNASRGVSAIGLSASLVSQQKSAVSVEKKLDNKGATVSTVKGSSGEKRISSQAQNRNDFFNIIRQKTLNRSSELPELKISAFLHIPEKYEEQTTSFSVSFSEDKESSVTYTGSESTDNVVIANSDNIVIREPSKDENEDQMPLCPVTTTKHVFTSGGANFASKANHFVENCKSLNNCVKLAAEGRPAPLTKEIINSIDVPNCKTKNEVVTSSETMVIQSSLSLWSNEGSSTNTDLLLPTEADASWMEAVDAPSEEEADFLRRLGWDEHANGDVITPTEIKDFMRQHPERSLRLVDNGLTTGHAQ